MLLLAIQLSRLVLFNNVKILGKKNGKGYYVYERGSRPKPDASVQQILEQTRELTRIVADGQVKHFSATMAITLE